MAAEIFGDRFFSHRVPAWHGLGTVMDEELSALEAFNVMGPYKVEMEKLMTASGLETKYQGIIRLETTDDPYRYLFGVVGKDYALVTPDQIVAAWDESVGRHIETMGALKNGETLFLSTFLSDVDLGGELVKNYLLLTSPMTGNESIQVRLTSVRVVCQNTLITAKNLSAETLRVVHRKDPEEKLKEWLATLTTRSEQRTAALMEFFAAFSQYKLADAQAGYIIESVYPLPNQPRTDGTAEVAARREKNYDADVRTTYRNRTAVQELYGGRGLGQDLPTAKGTSWGLYNAVVEWEDYRAQRPRYRTSQLTSALFGARASIKERAFATLLKVMK